jgi:hypothetical protein
LEQRFSAFQVDEEALGCLARRQKGAQFHLLQCLPPIIDLHDMVNGDRACNLPVHSSVINHAA